MPLFDRPQSQRLFAMTDTSQIIDAYARIIADAGQRVSALYQVIASAAGCDPEVHQLWTTIGTERFTTAALITDLLTQRRGLRKGLPHSIARDIVWVYNDPGLHHALVITRGWSQKRYSDWIADTLHHHLQD